MLYYLYQRKQGGFKKMRKQELLLMKNIKSNLEDLLIKNHFKIYLFNRIIKGEQYNFFYHFSTAGDYISCETPENCFGYPDVILHDVAKDYVYTLYRYLPQWKMQKVHSVIDELKHYFGI